MNNEEAETTTIVPARVNRWYTHVGDFINTLKAFIGINYQGLPFAFAQAGLAFGLGGVLLIATLTDHCCQLLVSSKMLLVDRLCVEEAGRGALTPAEQRTIRERLERNMGYGDVGRLAFGNWCFRLIQVAVWLTQFIILIIYFVFIGTTVRLIFPLRMAPSSPNCTNLTLDSIGSIQPFPYILDSGCHNESSLEFFPRRSESAFFHITNIAAANQRVHYFTQGQINSNNFTRLASLKYPDRMFTSQWTIHNGGNCTGQPVTSHSYSADVTNAHQSEASSDGDMSTVAPTSTPADDSSAPDLRLVVLFPIPFFILTSMVRDVRKLAPFSVIATTALAGGVILVAVLLGIGFTKTCDYVLISKKFDTIPIFLTMMIASYEGIGCILPIHSSMVGARHLLPRYLHVCVYLIFVILCIFGTVGYLRYGSTVSQIIVSQVEQHTPFTICIDATLIISVLFTYPLQCFPVIQITERFIFSNNWLEMLRCCWRDPNSGFASIEEADRDREGLLDPSPPTRTGGLLTGEAETPEGSTAGSLLGKDEVAPWKRNVTRIVLTLVVAGLAVLMKDSFAYLGSFSGSVGASLLAFILPCCIDIKLRYTEMSKLSLVKDVCIIVFAICCSVLGLYSFGENFAP